MENHMRILITGVSGFVGSHLAESYKDYDVYGLVRRRSPRVHIPGFVKLVECDLTDSFGVYESIKEIMPTHIHHLAAQSFVPTSWKEPHSTFEINLFGTMNILEAVRRIDPKIKIHIVSTSEVYGNVEIPIRESSIPKPASPYGVSKLAMENLCSQYSYSYKMNIYITRAFNHTGPRRGEHFVESYIARSFALDNQHIVLGNINSIRDFTDVRDIVKAYKLSFDTDPGVPYNICSGCGHSVKDIIKILCEITGKDPEIRIDIGRIRPSDIDVLIGNSDKFKELTNWSSEIPFKKTVEDLYDYWRNNR